MRSRDAQAGWTFTPPPASLVPGQDFTIRISGSVKVVDKGQPQTLSTAPTATVYQKGLVEVKKQHAWNDGGSKMQNGEYVFRLPPGARGATIYFQADYGSGTFATYRYGDHKP